VIVQGEALNTSRLPTVVVVPATSNLRWASAPGNVLLKARRTGLPKDSVANYPRSLPSIELSSGSMWDGSRGHSSS